ncbi:alpha-(1-_3)-arabinofuranosyltransferase domain-containing protein [Nonomuraea sp. SYSU D8015]|uniref:alpha-(1->3)-arabinofuranosyltransferase domain-containing protein n=1 Tax=Nonomuraea sp. SYSU D8015 TaxID=2593644 RepID=UPI0016613999|nr:alpha-(1->3)-arabinofuranosyltransferase family protein [Nonomuraea sp. SYSU D8015]
MTQASPGLRGEFAESTAESYETRIRHRLRLLASCLLLGAIAFNTSTEKIIPETKLDMAVNPLGFLGRALHLWDGAYFGHLQNQAYGYLFPMGPFYALGLKLGMEAWTVQRLWMSLVLCTAFLGVVQLARALGIGGPHTRVIAGFVYALAPHAQALIGINSSEFLPSAVLPWILLPLVKGARRELSPRRAAALSALAFLFCGGVNAVAEAAVLLVPLVYLLTRAGGADKWRLIAWWLPLIALASMWWVAPLLTLGGYIFSFLPFIETASATTGVTSLVNALRGTSSWLSFLTVDGQTWLPDAHQQSTVPWLIVVTAAVAALGFAGLTLRRLPERPFLLISLLCGVAIITTGHPGTPHHELMIQLLDGPLAVFRNLHKFDALIRLPVALGVAGLLSLVRVRWRRPLTVAAVGLMGLSSLPILYAGLAPPGGFTAIPDHWKQAISWLNRNAGDGMVLAVPGAKRGEYLWGRPLDEPLQALSQARWATHTIVPWGSAGISRLMAAIDDRLATGEGSAGLTATLRRMGVTHLVVRNDLDRATIGTAWPVRVHQALEESPGISLVAQMGPGVGIAQYGKAAAWLDQPYHAVEIYQVSGAAPLVGTVDATRPLRVGGAPEAVLDLAEQGLLDDDRPVLLNDDPGQVEVPAQDTVLTDTLRHRELSYPDLRRNASATLTAGEPLRGDSPANDILDPGWRRYLATATFSGIAKVTASSSEADVTAAPQTREPGHQPFAALDGDRRTSWRSTGWNGAVGEWLEVTFTEPLTVSTIQVAFENSPIGPAPSEVVVETDTGSLRQRVRATADPQELVVPKGPISRLRLEVAATSHKPATRLGGRVGITELTIPGVQAGRSITVPDPDPGAGSGEPAAIALSRTGDVAGCVKGSLAWSCAKGHEVLGDDGTGFDRSFTVRKDGSYGVTGRTVLTDRTAIERLSTLPGDTVKVQASSTAVEHGAAGGRWAFDGDPKTAWFADPLDPRPTLSVELARRMRLSQIRVVTPDSYLGAPPIRVTIRAEGGVRQSWVGKDGLISFPAMSAQKLKLEFGASGGRSIEISDIAFPGVRPLGPLTGFPLRMPCGFGPTFTVNGEAMHTEIVDGTLDDVVTGEPVTFRSCEPLRLEAGPSRMAVRPGEAYRIESAIIRPEPGGRAAAPVEMRETLVESWGAGERVVKVSVTDDSYLVVNENFNSGWRAELGVVELKPVRLDGWRQAWFLPAYTAGTVTLTYEPDASYRAGLAVGGVLAVLVAVLALVRTGPTARHFAPMRPARLRAAHVLPFAVALGFWVGGVPGAAVVGALYALGAWLRPLREAEHVRAGPRRRLLFGPAAGVALYLVAAALVAAGMGGLWPQLLCLPLLAQLLAEIPARRAPARQAEIPVPVAAGGPTMTSVP